MVVKRQRTHAGNGFRDRFIAICEVPALEAGFFPAVLGRPAAIADACGMRKQITDRDRPCRVFEYIAAAAVGYGNLHVAPFGNIAAERVADGELALLLQDHDAGADDGLGLGSDAENGVVGHRRAVFLVAPAVGGGKGHLPVAQHEYDLPGDAVLVHIGLKVRIERFEPLGGHADLFRIGLDELLRQRRARKNEYEYAGQ